MGKSKKGGAKAAGEKTSKAAAEERGDEAEDSAAAAAAAVAVAAAEQSAGTGSKGGAKGKSKGKGKGKGNANGKGSKQEDGEAAAKGKAAKGKGKREADDAGPTKAEKKRAKRAAKAAEKVRAATNYWSWTRTHISAIRAHSGSTMSSIGNRSQPPCISLAGYQRRRHQRVPRRELEPGHRQRNGEHRGALRRVGQ